MKAFKKFVSSIIWWTINCFFCNFPGKGIRKTILRIFGMKIGKKVTIYEGFHIRNPRGITLHDGVSIGPKVLLDGRRSLVIGENATIAYEAIIWTLNHDYNDPCFSAKGEMVEIGKYAWICSRSIILPGIKVGNYAIVASGAVVTNDVPEYAIVAGIPARIIGYRKKQEYTYGYQPKKGN